MKKEDIRPVGDQIYYEIISAERTTDAGLVLPGVEDEYSPVIGRVISIGEQVDSNRFATGVKILLSRGVSFKVPLGGFASKDAAFLVDKKYVLAMVN